MECALEGICCASLIGEHLINIKNNISWLQTHFSRSFHQYYVKFKTTMQTKTHHSLHRLQNDLCQELKNLELRQNSHKKASLSASLKTPSKMATSVCFSESKIKRTGKSPLVQVNSSRGKAKVSSKKPLNPGFSGELKESKQQKLKKKGALHFKSKSKLWEMSNASTKCNDSKVQNASITFNQLMKKNNQYQQIIRNQRDLIQKLERIINETQNDQLL